MMRCSHDIGIYNFDKNDLQPKINIVYQVYNGIEPKKSLNGIKMKAVNHTYPEPIIKSQCVELLNAKRFKNLII